MMRSFYNGVSGVKTHSFGMDLLANNISNINTVGYKAAVPEFKDIFYQSNDVGGLFNFGANQVGLAASGLSSAFSQKQGSLVLTDRPLDLALEGKGFFSIKDLDGKNYFTRNGQFGIDSENNLVDSFGRFVLGTMNAGFSQSAMSEGIRQMFGTSSIKNGYSIDNEDLDIKLNAPNAQGTIKLPNTLFMNARATKNVVVKGNLSNEFKEVTKMTPLEGITFNINPDNTSTFLAINLPPNARVFLYVDRGAGLETIEAFANEKGELFKQITGTVQEFKADLVEKKSEAVVNKFEIATIDKDGNTVYLDLSFQAIDDITYQAKAILKDTKGEAVSESEGLISFNPDGSLRENELNQVGDIALDLGTPKIGEIGGYSGLTSLNNSKIERFSSADGFAAGVLKDYYVDFKGNIVANFTNGKSQAVAKLAVFNFINEQGLYKNGENEFEVSPDSGKPMFFYDENNEVLNPFKIKSNYIEQSNVDLATELTQVIAFQKAYEANAKSITTADQMLKRAIEMKK